MFASSSPRMIILHSPMSPSIFSKTSSTTRSKGARMISFSAKIAISESCIGSGKKKGVSLSTCVQRRLLVNRCRRGAIRPLGIASSWPSSGEFSINTNGIPGISNTVVVIRQFSSSAGGPSSSPGSKNKEANREEKSSSESIDSTASASTTSASPPLPPPSWVDTALPTSLQPYAKLARMDKPIGTMLLLWPCFWSTAIAAPAGSLPDFKLLGLFTVGSFVMRGAGCTINDMWDSDFDKSVSRTKTRPLASGQLTHRQASSFLLLQLSAGLGVLLSLPHLQYCFLLGSASLPLVFSYPLMKRYTNWPQLVLGLTFNWGALMGWAATHGSLDYGVVLPLYASGVGWTMVYDTLYAHQDKKDDAKLGLKSTALHFGKNTKPVLHTFSTFTFANWLLVGQQLGYDSWTYYGGCGLAYAHLLWQVHTAKLNEKEGEDNLGTRFRSNSHVGALMFLSCVAGNVLTTC